jgi:hypothetical protein
MAPPRKVGVLTFHRCINYGSYWQARCLVEGLRRRGLDAVVIDHHSARIQRAEWRCALSPQLPTRTPRSDFPAYAAKARKFFRRFAELPLSPAVQLENPSGMDAFNIVVVGSDEVWNLRHPWYAGYAAFFGDGLNAERVVSYAASFGNCDATEPLDGHWARKLSRFDAIGVRDENSRRIVQDAVRIDPEVVLDPCLQFQDICRWPAGHTADEVLVYGHSFPDWFARSVRAWADRRRIPLLSLGYRNDWADMQRLDAGPDEFAHAMAHARAVVTNFFHGCVFALVNDKPFVTAPGAYRRNKVTALASIVGAERRIVAESTPPARYDELLEDPVVVDVRRRIEGLRGRSSAYLDHALA